MIDYASEIAMRSDIEQLQGEEINGIQYFKYRFDIRKIFGDYEIVKIPADFADDKVARYALYQKLKSYENK